MTTAHVRWSTFTIDCLEAVPVGDFDALLLGSKIPARDGTDWLQLRDPDGGVGINVQAEGRTSHQRGPSSRAAKRRCPLKILVDDLSEALERVVRSELADPASSPGCWRWQHR